MPKRSTAPARALAVLALIGAAVALISIVSGSLGDDGDRRERPARQQGQRGNDSGRSEQEKIPRFYEVQPGDNLELISQRTGVAVARIEELNPAIDALNLPVGARLELR